MLATSTGLPWVQEFCANGSCIQVAYALMFYQIRDSKDPDGSRLLLDQTEYRAFISAVQEGAYEQYEAHAISKTISVEVAEGDLLVRVELTNVQWRRPNRHHYKGNPIEIGFSAEYILMRYANFDGPPLVFTIEEWRNFVRGSRKYLFGI